MFPFSRYQYNVAMKDDGGNLFLDEREPFRYREERDNRYYKVIEGDTLWGLAYIFFQSFPRPSQFYWLIAEYQPEPIVDATLALKAGTVLVIPSERIVRMKVFSEEQRRYH